MLLRLARVYTWLIFLPLALLEKHQRSIQIVSRRIIARFAVSASRSPMFTKRSLDRTA